MTVMYIQVHLAVLRFLARTPSHPHSLTEMEVEQSIRAIRGDVQSLMTTVYVQYTGLSLVPWHAPYLILIPFPRSRTKSKKQKTTLSHPHSLHEG